MHNSAYLAKVQQKAVVCKNRSLSNTYYIGVGAGPVLAGPLFLAVPAGLVFGRTTGPLEQHSNPTLGLHVLLVGPLFEAVLRHCITYTLYLNKE